MNILKKNIVDVDVTLSTFLAAPVALAEPYKSVCSFTIMKGMLIKFVRIVDKWLLRIYIKSVL